MNLEDRTFSVPEGDKIWVIISEGGTWIEETIYSHGIPNYKALFPDKVEINPSRICTVLWMILKCQAKRYSDATDTNLEQTIACCMEILNQMSTDDFIDDDKLP